jgi:sterol desaturase/sphingolipid hydroxylase (fatty acid hydroxylase superfamily)
MYVLNKCCSLFLKVFVFLQLPEIVDLIQPEIGNTNSSSADLTQFSLVTVFIVGSIFALFTDFARFLSHLLRHRVGFLWELHKVHHSATTLSPMTGGRVHPFEILVIYGLTLVFQLVAAFGLAALGFHLTSGFVFYESIYAAYSVTHHFRHSHFPISYGPAVEKIFVSPLMHQYHHSNDPNHLNKNFGFVFSFWDILFQSYLPTDRRKETNFCMGLGKEGLKYNSLQSLLFLPIFQTYNSLLNDCFSTVQPKDLDNKRRQVELKTSSPDSV